MGLYDRDYMRPAQRPNRKRYRQDGKFLRSRLRLLKFNLWLLWRRIAGKRK